MCLWIYGEKPIDASDIERDGGRDVVTQDGRIIEYFVWGSEQKDATVAVICHSVFQEGKEFNQYLYPHEVIEKLNVKVIVPSLPGHGNSDVQPSRRISDWPNDDLLPIFRKRR